MLGIIIDATVVLVLVALVEGYNADSFAYYEKLGVNKVELSVDYLDSTRAEDFSKSLQAYTSTEMSTFVAGVTPLATISWKKEENNPI